MYPVEILSSRELAKEKMFYWIKFIMLAQPENTLPKISIIFHCFIRLQTFPVWTFDRIIILTPILIKNINWTLCLSSSIKWNVGAIKSTWIQSWRMFLFVYFTRFCFETIGDRYKITGSLYFQSLMLYIANWSFHMKKSHMSIKRWHFFFHLCN